MDTDAALDPNPVTATGSNTTAHIALENNSDQLDEFARGDFPNPDYADQAIEVATSLYIESNGVINTNPYAGASTINGTSYAAQKVEENAGFTDYLHRAHEHVPDGTDPVQHLQLRHRAGVDGWVPELDL